MKTKIFLFLLLLASAGTAWFYVHPHPVPASVAAGRQALYYTCAMHPWVRESNPGPCPVCGMNLTPIYAGETGSIAETNSSSGLVILEPDSIRVLNVQTDPVERRPVRRTLHISGQIIGNSSTAAWFEFTVYQRDLAWLGLHESFDVTVTGIPDKSYSAQIKPNGAKPFADRDFDMMSGSTTVRAEISDPPVEVGDFGRNRLFNNLHAEAHINAETEAVLAVPRSAVISRGLGPVVYVDQGNGHYEPHAVSLGRIGNEYAEVLAGLQAGEKVVTAGNVLIDSEAQLTAGR